MEGENLAKDSTQISVEFTRHSSQSVARGYTQPRDILDAQPVLQTGPLDVLPVNLGKCGSVEQRLSISSDEQA